MKKLTLCFVLVLFVAAHLIAQVGTKVLTNPLSTSCNVKGNCEQVQNNTKATTDLEFLWQVNEPYAVISSLGYCNGIQKSFANWQLNDGRIALYGNSNTPEWEFATTADWTTACANEAGTIFIIADGNIINVLDPTNGTSANTITVAGEVKSIVAKTDGTGFFVCYSEESTYTVAAFSKSSTTPSWTINGCVSSAVGLSIANDDSKLIAAFAQPIEAIWIINPETGAIIQDDIYYYDNSPTQSPALSDNGEYLTFTDFSGKASLYHWDGDEYKIVWKAPVLGEGSSSTWGCGNAISADGSLIAIGTLDFVASGFDGAVYLFNNYSTEPIWSCGNMGDEVTQISMSNDGSIIACATYGPMDHSKPDFYLFRKQSNTPLGTINTTGSMECVDISEDGSRCFVAGKAVHAREMGYGSNAFFINCIPANSGSLAGVADLLGSDIDDNVKVTIQGIDNYFESTAEDGSYSIKYVPAGTYSVSFTKPGYNEQSFDGIVISNGEITTLNAELEAAGNPLNNLFASQGAFDFVQLTWDAYQGNCSGYNIYRKNSENAPFDEPLASIGSENNTYQDATVIPTNAYYYVVTAIIEGDQETPYSNVAMGFASITAIVEEIDVFEGYAPTIDGIMSDNEWNDAFSVDVSNYLGGTAMGSVILHFKMDDSYLYVCSENHLDTEFNDNEGVALYIDDNHDGNFPESGDNSEGNYWMYYGSTGNTVRFRPIYNTGGVGEVINLPEEIIAVSNAEGYEIIEFALPFGSEETWQINPSDDNKSGLYLFVRDAANATMYGKWPADNDATFNPAYYGVLNYHVEDEMPPAPENLRVNDEVLSQGQYAPISWDMSDINDLGHFNVYVNSSSATSQTNGTQIILNVEENTQYSVFVTTVDAAGQESGHSETLTFTSGSVNTTEAETSTFALYPNPAKSSICITSGINESGNLKIMDITGRTVKAIKSEDLGRTEITIEGLDSGMYFVVIDYANTIVIRKFMVE